MVFLVWLEWKEKCFRASASDIAHLKSRLPKGAKVVRVRTERAFLKALPQATHALVWHFRREWYAIAKKLQVLATPAAGRELVAQPSKPSKPLALHFGHFHGPLMAESVVAFILGWARGFFRRCPDSWSRTWLSDKVTEVVGTKAVVVGYGHVGRAIGEKLSALGVEVAGINSRGVVDAAPGWARSRASALSAADWVILALPSTTGTDGYADAAFLRKLRRGAVLINVGRGNAVDESALVSALRSKRIAGAYLDVRNFEPSGTVPVFGKNEQALEQLENCILMPHASAFSPRYLKLAIDELVAEM